MNTAQRQVMDEDPTETLAKHLVSTRQDTIPTSTLAAAKHEILDTLGAMLGGSTVKGIDTLAGVVRSWGGNGEATMIDLGGRYPAPQAALINGAMGHALDFDDSFDEAGSIHPGTTALAASLAAAQLSGKLSGLNLLVAIALGVDVSCRLALAARSERGWHRTSAIGIFGATAAAAKIRHLNVEQMINAFGIAYSQAAGNRQSIVDAALTKRLQAGQAASGAVIAVELARRGFTGARHVFAGRYGFYPLYQPGDDHLDLITRDLGVTFLGERLSFKPYPCDRGIHVAIDAARHLHRKLNLSCALALQNLGSVALFCNAKTHHEYFGPHACRYPTHMVEAQFSLPYLLSIALKYGEVGIEDITRVDEAVFDVVNRIEGYVDDSLLGGDGSCGNSVSRRTHCKHNARGCVGLTQAPTRPRTTTIQVSQVRLIRRCRVNCSPHWPSVQAHFEP